jgi:adenine-specific DNA methylase
MPRRYIEDVLPLAELNKYAQKGGGIGSLNAMHPYFARRPLTASRAMTLAALVDAPETEAEREALEHLLVELSSEEWPEMPDLLHRARELIREAHDGKEPRVLDPFAGGGSMPLEALRLGSEATALDLNPVAYLALIASLVYPQRFGQGDRETRRRGEGGQRDKEKGGGGDGETGGQGTCDASSETLPGIEGPGEEPSDLADDIEYWAEWVMTQAQAQIGECYPVDDDGAVPVAYLWAKTVQCPHCGGEVPLIRRRWLHKRKGKTPVAYRLHVDREAQSYTVEILEGPAAREADPERGTMRGATVECPYCGTPTERERIAEQGRAGRMDQHLLVVVLNREDETGREFRAATEADRAAFQLAEEKLAQAEAEGFDFWGFERLLSVVPDEPTPSEGARSISIRLYGVESWGDLFNPRQSLTLAIFGQQIRLVRDLLAEKDKEYAQAIALYLSIVLGRYITRSSVMTVWDSSRNTISSLFARHDIQMTWDYAEADPFSGSAGSWESQLNVFLYSIEHLVDSDARSADVRLASVTDLPEDWTGTFDAVITDPPYYDSVTYGDLTDYFYPWHKRIVGDDYPEAFVTEVTPKDQELVQEAIYHGGSKTAAKQFYEDGMAKAFAEMHRVLRDDGIAVVMFAHKKSSAWETLVSALIRAGFRITASWPLNTEGRRLQSYRAVALASSVYLVCRKRINGGEVGYLEDIENDLRTTIRRYLERFWAAGIGGADFFMSAIGPGLSVFSRCERIERYDGSRVSVSDFLDLVRHEVASFAVERIVGEEGFSERLDQPTQFYLLWRWGYGQWDVPDGEAVLLSTAVGIDLGVLMERIGLVGKVKRKLRLLPPADREAALEKVVERVTAGGAVPLIDVLHKACLLWERDQQEELAALVAARGGEMWPVAQAMVELLPRDNAERKALMSLLGTRVDLEQRASRWAETHRREAPPEARQLGLWGEDA